MPEYFTVKEVAKRLKRSPRTIYEWIREGYLQAKRVKDGYLISEDHISAILVDYVPEGAEADEELDDL